MNDMEEKIKEFYGELGEFISPSTSMVKTEGEEQHAAIAMNLDGYIPDKDGSITLIISPAEAKRLCNEIMNLIDVANDINYNLLRHKAPF